MSRKQSTAIAEAATESSSYARSNLQNLSRIRLKENIIVYYWYLKNLHEVNMKQTKAKKMDANSTTTILRCTDFSL
jgi:hypothetical protein